MLLFHLSRIISKNKAPFYGGRKIFRSHLAPPIHTGGNLLLAAAHAIVVAATAATVTATAAVAANQTVVAAAAEQQNKNDNPPAAIVIIAHNRTSDKFIKRFCRSFQDIPGGKFCASPKKTAHLFRWAVLL